MTLEAGSLQYSVHLSTLIELTELVPISRNFNKGLNKQIPKSAYYTLCSAGPEKRIWAYVSDIRGFGHWWSPFFLQVPKQNVNFEWQPAKINAAFCSTFAQLLFLIQCVSQNCWTNHKKQPFGRDGHVNVYALDINIIMLYIYITFHKTTKQVLFFCATVMAQLTVQRWYKL